VIGIVRDIERNRLTEKRDRGQTEKQKDMETRTNRSEIERQSYRETKIRERLTYK
jgi:hypothetical protein